MRIRTLVVALLAVLLVGASAPAQAQTFLTPYIGSSFNSTVDEYDFGTKLHYGAALTWIGQSGLGFEVDFGYAPSFYDPGEDEFFDFAADGSVTTLMANIVLGGGGGGLKPYASGGLGLMRSRIETFGDFFEFEDNNLGINVGGGIRGGSERVGVRGDLRYFRQVSDFAPFNNFGLGDFSFWRGTVGLSLGF